MAGDDSRDGGSGGDRRGYFIPGGGDRRDVSYWKSWEQRQEGCFILEIVGAATGGMLHTGNRGSSDRRDASYWKSWEQRQEGCFIPTEGAVDVVVDRTLCPIILMGLL